MSNEDRRLLISFAMWIVICLIGGAIGGLIVMKIYGAI